ncbi:alpha/beta hydrolase [Actinotalea sp. M2MS4P-6]|uniref:alpha/beta hydrolase n=1 Tax=Actinotalea sp. M2MS4P-6 TaxID=2983762 RepID=UPI0021E39EEB|nr:alpha/beta hydrolase [Actinotalea sp. M2MS4P-6]MCV2396306.1 alpha/beta hydrolase [Actinotalea sp. M2MS4P-6]
MDRLSDWRPDLLPGWQQATIDLGEDDEGPLVATLVRRDPGEPEIARHLAAGRTAQRPAVLYVHGFNDYFFHTHVADALAGEGYQLYALDLRRCGRSMRAGQTPHWCTDLTEYAEELTIAARLLRGELGHDRLVVMGHSTGGLVASLWAHSLRHARVVDALVLNSPWFDLNAGWFHRVVSTRILDVAPVDPRQVVVDGPSAYSWHLHVDHGGRWDYDLDLKPPGGFPVRASWLRAVRRGQSRLARGLEIAAPVLVATSTESGPNTLDNPALDAQDTVLDVEQIVDRALRLGTEVTLLRVPGAVHDLALSAPRPRAIYLDAVLAWLAAVLDHADDATVAADREEQAARAGLRASALSEEDRPSAPGRPS